MSPWPNLSTSIRAALADSDVGSWNPPADRLLATGTPKTARGHHHQQRDDEYPARRLDGHQRDALQHVIALRSRVAIVAKLSTII